MATEKGLKISWTYNQSDVDWFWKRVVKGADENDCWSWSGAIRGGYARMQLNRRQVDAHVFSNMALNGYSPHSGITRHDCDNRICTNPKHLQGGTYQDNNDDMMHRDRSQSILTNETVKAIYAAIVAGEEIGIVANTYNTSIDSIRMICKGQTWTHLNLEPIEWYCERKRRLEEAAIVDIFTRYQNRYHGLQRELARRYNVSDGYISGVISGLHSKDYVDSVLIKHGLSRPSP